MAPNENGGSTSASGSSGGGGTVDADVSNVWDKIDSWVDGFFTLLPNLVTGLVVLGLFIGLGFLVKNLVQNVAAKRGRQDLGRVGGSLLHWALGLTGLLLAVTIVAPSVAPADLIAGLGVSSVAIGFAFKDVLQNLLAGVLILLRQPFEVGDQIVSGDHEGTVERIETRATILKTYDGRRVVVPNGDIYTNAVVVNTAHAHIRSQYDVGIGYADAVPAARNAILEAMQSVQGVVSDPAPEVLAWELAGSAVNLRARWWTDSERASVVQVRDRVIESIKQRLDEEAVDMPYPTQVVLFHDQTEATDGDRTAQREGWPAGEDPPEPRDDDSQRSHEDAHAAK